MFPTTRRHESSKESFYATAAAGSGLSLSRLENNIKDHEAVALFTKKYTDNAAFQQALMELHEAGGG